MSTWTGKWKEDDAVFCPYEITCSAGIPVAKNGAYQCGQCTDGFISSLNSNITFLIVSPPNSPINNGTYIVDNNTVKQQNTKLCKSCGTNAHTNSSNNNCNCDFGWTSNAMHGYTSVAEYDCTTPRVFTVNLIGNNGLSNATIYYKYGVGYDHSDEGTFNENLSIHPGNTDVYPKHEIVGWSLRSDGEIYLYGNTFTSANHAKNIANAVSPDGTNPNPTIKLYPIWAPKTYTVTPLSIRGEYPWDSGPTCTYGDTCYVPNPEVYDYENTPEGHYISHWECNECANKTIQLGGKIEEDPDNEFPNNNVNIRPMYELCENGFKCTGGKRYNCGENKLCVNGIEQDCPDGYYCENGQQKDCPAGYYCPAVTGKQPCPAGTTSDTGAETRNDCYLGPGVTQFCNQATERTCITLPTSWGNAGKRLYYHD